MARGHAASIECRVQVRRNASADAKTQEVFIAAPRDKVRGTDRSRAVEIGMKAWLRGSHDDAFPPSEPNRDAASVAQIWRDGAQGRDATAHVVRIHHSALIASVDMGVAWRARCAALRGKTSLRERRKGPIRQSDATGGTHAWVCAQHETRNRTTRIRAG
jgi:hypothetical protein